MEECLAICKLKGVQPGASLAEQLKAIDKEYKALLEAGQSSRADHVQALYAWRSKEANMVGYKCFLAQSRFVCLRA